ncbi:MAG TPA: hypothetical protein DCM45_04585 [Clostridiales bacterium]|nr:hypothetical protein [Clostridiales bacterium]
MKSLFDPIKVILILLALIGAIMPLGSCAASNGEGFAIYLTRDNISPSKMEALSHVELADQPIIAQSDIISYNIQTCELKLTKDAFERISQLQVPTTGTSFLVCVNHSPVYWGAFWTPISSQSFDGVTIWQMLPVAEPYIVTFELGYPSSDFYGGEDPRNKPIIIDALKKAGLLIEALDITKIESLPRSMKGYELYSWPDGNTWRFTLITGTNRNKTLAEITTGESYISETGWINIHVTGVDKIKDVLSKIPQGEFVSWLDGGFVTEKDGLTLPPQQIIDEVVDFAVAQGLDMRKPK